MEYKALQEKHGEEFRQSRRNLSGVCDEVWGTEEIKGKRTFTVNPTQNGDDEPNDRSSHSAFIRAWKKIIIIVAAKQLF